jgi:hypothetical protein
MPHLMAIAMRVGRARICVYSNHFQPAFLDVVALRDAGGRHARK